MAGIGASRPLRRIPAIVSFLNPQPALSLVGGNRSSCPKADPTAPPGIGRVVASCPWLPGVSTVRYPIPKRIFKYIATISERDGRDVP